MQILKRLFKRRDLTDRVNAVKELIQKPLVEQEALDRINKISQTLIDSVNETKIISGSIIAKLSDDLTFTRRQIDVISSNLSDGLISVDARRKNPNIQ